MTSYETGFSDRISELTSDGFMSKKAMINFGGGRYAIDALDILRAFSGKGVNPKFLTNKELKKIISEIKDKPPVLGGRHRVSGTKTLSGPFSIELG